MQSVFGTVNKEPREGTRGSASAVIDSDASDYVEIKETALGKRPTLEAKKTFQAGLLDYLDEEIHF